MDVATGVPALVIPDLKAYSRESLPNLTAPMPPRNASDTGRKVSECRAKSPARFLTWAGTFHHCAPSSLLPLGISMALPAMNILGMWRA